MIRKNILSIVFLLAVVSCFAQIEEVTLNNLSINSNKMEFGAVPNGNGLLYTSTNGEAFDGKIDKCNSDDYFAKMFYADRDDMSAQELKTETGLPEEGAAGTTGDPACGFKNVRPVGGDVSGKYHDGTPTVSPDGNKMVFARNYPGKSNFMNACNDNKLNFRLMSADKVGDQWTNVQELPIGGEDFNTAHPTFSADGRCLYFASDRPGGSGGMDLYKACMEGEGWSVPMNLGSTVNTAGNELFPYLANTGDLYYSTNGLDGNGGLDVFSTSMADGAWSTPANIGAPFNSAGDDLGFVLLPDGESGYLTSNRAGGKGGDDIYCWKINKAPVTLAVEDAATRARIGNALVNVKELRGTEKYTTDANGMTTPDITYRRCYEVEVDEPGYEYWSKEVCADEMAAENPYIVPLVKKAFPLGGNVIWEDKSIAPDSRVVLYNKITGDSTVITANNDGQFDLDINCIDDYELVAYKSGKESARVDLPASSIDCNGGGNAVTLVLPKPPPPPAPVCDCTTNTNPAFNVPVGTSPKVVRRLGSRPQFGKSNGLSGADFYNKLKDRYNSSTRDAEFLDGVFQAMGYSGFADANEFSFTDTVLSSGITGNMGYTSRHKIKYMQLNTKGEDLDAFRINARNGCHVHFMKTCGNFFFFCTN